MYNVKKVKNVLTRSVLVAMALLLSLGAAPVANAQFPGVNGRIISYAIGYGGVSVKPDGSNYYGHNIPFVNLGTTKGEYAYSPDGTKIAYSVADAGSVNIYIKSSSSIVNGTALTASTASFQDSSPVFSPDGTKIAFERRAVASPNLIDIYVINTDGTGLIRLTNLMFPTNTPTTYSSVETPVWAPDGSVIYVATYDYPAVAGTGIYSISPTTPNQATATSVITAAQMTGFIWNSQFDIAPDGSRFVYQSSSGNNGTLRSIRSVAFNGTGDIAVVTSDTTGYWELGGYSPDGTKLVAMHNTYPADPAVETMVVMATNGTAQTAIWTNAANGQPFDYSTDFAPFWGTGQDTYTSRGSFGAFQSATTPGAPNTTTTKTQKSNTLPWLASGLALLALFGAAGMMIRKEFKTKK